MSPILFVGRATIQSAGGKVDGDKADGSKAGSGNANGGNADGNPVGNAGAGACLK
jgi:hypothetical protein